MGAHHGLPQSVLAPETHTNAIIQLQLDDHGRPRVSSPSKPEPSSWPVRSTLRTSTYAAITDSFADRIEERDPA